MNIISISEARQKLPQLIDDVDARFERLYITKNGKAKAVLMAAEDFESWMETIASYEDPETMERVKEIDKMTPRQMRKSKKFITFDELKKRLNMEK